MALVAYGNSDSSDYEDDENENQTVATLIKKPEGPEPSTPDQAPKTILESKTEDGPSLFNLLPQPSTTKPAVVEEDDEYLHKKEKVPDVVKPKARITVPSLRDFKDVDSPAPVAKPKITNGKKSGLLSMLPQPKNGLTTSKFLMPHVLSQKNNANTNKKSPGPSPVKKPKVESKKLLNDYSDESDNDDEVQNDFFSIHKPVEIPFADISVDIDHNLDKEVPVNSTTERSKLESYFKKDPVENDLEQESQHVESYEEYVSSEAGSSYNHGNRETEDAGNSDMVLDEEAILKLCGARGKRRREDIQIVDVNQKEVLADAREWLLKGLMDDTTKRVSASKKRGHEPTSQQKRKHQITYLAHQAKANEAELQNQWANSRMSRRQTQNKYGF